MNNIDVNDRLAGFLTGTVGSKGTHIMCYEGGCGVCTVTAKVPLPETSNGTKTISLKSVELIFDFLEQLLINIIVYSVWPRSMDVMGGKLQLSKDWAIKPMDTTSFKNDWQNTAELNVDFAPQDLS